MNNKNKKKRSEAEKLTAKKNKNTEKQNKEKREFRIALLVVLLIIGGFVSSAFLPDIIKDLKYKMSIEKLKSEDYFILDEKGNKYVMQNRSVEAINTDGLYGKLDGAEFYYIEFMKDSTPTFIVEGTGFDKRSVYALESHGNITISSFKAVSADIALGDADKPHDLLKAHDKYLENGGNNPNDEKYINLIVDALQNGEQVPDPMKISDSYRIKLKSKDYPGLYYTVMFQIDENGIAYLYDTGAKKSVYCPDEITVRITK